tara:strand:- start:2234 stop:2392 length:159 start_codon:yes stop_codon:yes gene_type:complete
MKSFATKMFLVLFVSLTALSCVKAALEDAANELENDLNDQESVTELVIEDNN